jgi:Fe-S cluster assembly protein SufD
MSGVAHAGRPLAAWLEDLPTGPALLSVQRRRRAAEAFLREGLPTRRLEDWRYTDLGSLGEERFLLEDEGPSQPVAAQLDALIPTGVAGDTLVFVNGRLRPDLSAVGDLPAGVVLGSLQALRRSATAAGEANGAMLAALDAAEAAGDGVFGALNAALAGEGCGLYLPAGLRLERPVQVIQLSIGKAPLLVQPRLLVIAEEGSRATVFEAQGALDAGRSFCNSIAEFHLGAGAQVEHIRVQRDDADGRRVSGLDARIGAEADFRSHTLTTGGALVRNESRLRLEGAGARGEINGLYLLDGQSHVDNHTRVEHLVPDGSSRQVFKGVLDGRSRGVFTGRIYVAQDAQRTDAEQSANSLLLSDEARGWTRPQLEIYADDVKCTHGATVGSLSADSLFYLRARGLPASLARRLLIHAFASELLARVRTAPLIAPLDRLITRTLAE